tara:strand:- start:31137 stop:33026 length:1890 start_codon:yes stop_codon:yes gene_type:complete
VKKFAVLTAVFLLAVPIHSIAEETTVIETFDNQEINTDITFVYGASDTVVSAATTQSPDCASTQEAGLIGIEDMDCFQSVYFGNDRYQLGIRGSSDNLTIAFPNEPYEVGLNYGAIDQGSVSGTVYYDNGVSETFTLDVNTDMTIAGSKVFVVAEGVETFITEIVIEGIADWWLIDNVYYKYDNVPTTTTSSSTTTTTTTTTTTLPKAADVVEDNITTYLAWDENGCEHPNNPLSYKQYLEAIESGDWFGYQPGDCTDIPDIVVEIIEEEIDDELDEEILEDDTLTEEVIEEEVIELTEEEIAVIEAEIKAEEERLLQEQLDAEKEEEILLELEESTIVEDLSEEEVEELVEVIKEIEETIEIIEIEEEVIELDIPDDIIIVIEEEVIEDESIIVVEDKVVDEEVLDEPIQEDVEKEPIELTDEEIVEEVAEIVEVIDIPVSDEDLTEEEIVEVIDEYVEELETEEVIEVLEEVNDVGVQNLEEVSEEVQEVIQAVVEEAIEDVAELTDDQVEVVAEVLQVETEDVEIIAEAVKQDDTVAQAVEEYVERAVENADVENYTLADVVTEVAFEEFIEDPLEVILDIDIQDINITDIGSDMTTDQKEKAQEVVVPVILTRIATMASFIFRRS